MFTNIFKLLWQVTYIPKAGHKTQLISEFESSNIKTMADVWKWSVKKWVTIVTFDAL